MIIRITIGDNDFAYDLEQFCDHLRDKMFTNEEPWPKKEQYDTKEEYMDAIIARFNRNEALKATRHRLLDTDKRLVKNTSEYNEVCDEVKRIWKEEMDEFLSRMTPDVSIQYSLDELDENGEVVYYFSTHDQFITQ